jgi:hypothetical protein
LAPRDKPGDVIMIAEFYFDPASLSQGIRVQIIFHRSFARQNSTAAGTTVDLLGCPLSFFSQRRDLAVEKVKFRQRQTGQPVRPVAEVASTDRNEDDFSRQLKRA